MPVLKPGGGGLANGCHVFLGRKQVGIVGKGEGWRVAGDRARPLVTKATIEGALPTTGSTRRLSPINGRFWCMSQGPGGAGEKL